VLFVEPKFFLFFLALAAIYWSLPRNTARKLWLLGASYLFYAAWDYRFLSLILISTLVDHTVALKIQATGSRKSRKQWLAFSLATNLGILFSFKYFNFFADSLNSLMAGFGLEMGYNTLHIILPVGISFYTFQTLSYTIDVYRGHLEPRRKLLDVALFVAFFPQLVAGPIMRASHFLPQLDTTRRFNDVPVKACVALFLIGFFKKAVLSDNMAPYVDAVFENPMLYNSASIRMGVMLYAIQIYCDFSGYSDMAIAVAGLLGYQIPINFASPYLSFSVTEFWRRWHISLSSWLRDYLYIPLGGSRRGVLLTYRNLMITMLLGGLWHGAAWNFVIWGGMHGFALSVERAWKQGRVSSPIASFLARPFQIVFTLYWVCLAWIFFRARDLSDAVAISSVWLGFGTDSVESVGAEGLLWLIPTAMAAHWLFHRVDVMGQIERRTPWGIFWLAYGAAFALAVGIVSLKYRPFIYFQF
jgi:alginate O-acetyltransferase complex protein AlgI